jgi:hypothetical protein
LSSTPANNGVLDKEKTLLAKPLHADGMQGLLLYLAGAVREILSASAEILSTSGGNSLAEGEILSVPVHGG